MIKPQKNHQLQPISYLWQWAWYDQWSNPKRSPTSTHLIFVTMRGVWSNPTIHQLQSVWSLWPSGGCDSHSMQMVLQPSTRVTSLSWMMVVVQVGFLPCIPHDINDHCLMCHHNLKPWQDIETSWQPWSPEMRWFKRTRSCLPSSTQRSLWHRGKNETGRWGPSSRLSRFTCSCPRRDVVWWRKPGYSNLLVVDLKFHWFPQTVSLELCSPEVAPPRDQPWRLNLWCEHAALWFQEHVGLVFGLQSYW